MQQIHKTVASKVIAHTTSRILIASIDHVEVYENETAQPTIEYWFQLDSLSRGTSRPNEDFRQKLIRVNCADMKAICEFYDEHVVAEEATPIKATKAKKA